VTVFCDICDGCSLQNHLVDTAHDLGNLGQAIKKSLVDLFHASSPGHPFEGATATAWLAVSRARPDILPMATLYNYDKHDAAMNFGMFTDEVCDMMERYTVHA